ncbi:helix-turn-helix domain-containing protein [Streptomyces capillispiralis]|uniref:helix-turn-helix domain-containing protein n=1 Tax=Streptomyces capillispiralis TaxID=68182 RepID=UPI00142EE315|nr:transcriptional regulator [Streptomyces capillispiralis]
MSGDTAAARFAALLGELKERSGLSYGVLAKRLHMSTSTLHRYCNGDAVPTDYAPVERLARLCRARPEELVELHRRWVLADAARGRRPAGASGSAGAVVSGGTVEAVVPDGSVAPAGGETSGGEKPGGEPVEGRAAEVHADGDGDGDGGGGRDGEGAGDGAGPAGVAEIDGPNGAPRPRPRTRTRTRTAVLAGIAVAAVLGGAALAVSLSDGGADGGGRRGSAGATSVDGKEVTSSPSPSATPSASASASVSASASPSASSGGKGKGPGAAPTSGASSAGAPPGGSGVPLTVRTDPYAWQDPCSQRYLIDRPSSEVSPPPMEQDAPAWVAAFGAVPSGEQYVRLTVQGTGAETVVVDELTVRVAGKRSPLAWNDFAMGYPGVGCGGDVPTRSFTVALDAARPVVVPESGHRNFPFKVSQSDPEVFHISADASAYEVKWYLELKWSSGSRSGTLTVDDKGRPFRISGNNGRAAYEFPLGGEEWVPEGTTELG